MVNDKNTPKVGAIHKPHMQKLGRRGLMKKLLGMGFTVSSAAAITIEDIKAASSDEVPIVVGYRRKDLSDLTSERVPYKKNVPKDWYNQVQKSRRKKNEIADDVRSREGVLGVGLTSIDKSSRPGILVIVDKNKPEVGRRNIPTNVGDIPVEITESSRGKPFASCDTSQLRGWSKNNSDLYSGYEINVNGSGDPGSGTNTCVVWDGQSSYGLSCYHVLKDSGNNVADGVGNSVGTVTDERHCREDWALFSLDDVGWEQKVKFGQYDGITGSFTKDGVADLVNSNAGCSKVGKRTCKSSFEAEAYDVQYWVEGDCGSAPHQVYYEAQSDDFKQGDSGSLVYHESPDNSSHCWAVSMLAYGRPLNDNDIHGVGAWRITDRGYYFSGSIR